jgi:hypothetical protein
MPLCAAGLAAMAAGIGLAPRSLHAGSRLDDRGHRLGADPVQRLLLHSRDLARVLAGRAASQARHGEATRLAIDPRQPIPVMVSIAALAGLWLA